MNLKKEGFIQKMKERQKTDVNMNLATDPGNALLLAL